MHFLFPVGSGMCSRPPVTAALLGRRLPALKPTSGSSPSDSADIPALLSPPALRPTGVSPTQVVRAPPVCLLSSPLDSMLMEKLTLSENVSSFTVGTKLAASPPPALHYWERQGLLRSVSTIPFVPLRSPSSTSRRHMCPLWNGNPAPLKNVNLEQIIMDAVMLM